MTEQPESKELRFRGRIDAFNPDQSKRFGTVCHQLPDGNTVRIFFHADEFKTSVQKQIQVGRLVEYSVRKRRDAREEFAQSWALKAFDCVLIFDHDPLKMTNDDIAEYLKTPSTTPANA